MSDDEDERRVILRHESQTDLVMVGSRSRMTPNRMVRMAPTEAERDKEYLTLKVVRPSQEIDSVEIHFRVKRTTQMGKLKRSYSDRLGVHVTSLRFLYDGRRICDDATPGSLEMESGEYIEVYREMPSPEPSPVLSSSAAPSGLPAPNNPNIDSVVLDGGAGPGTGQELRRRRFSEDGGYDLHSKRVKLSTELSSQITLDIPQPLASSSGFDGLTNHDVGQEQTKENDDDDSLRGQLEQMTRRYDDLVKKLRDKVECPVCFEVPRSAPVPVCPNGHVVCHTCVRETCPTCRIRMQQGTSTLAVTVIENIEHFCEFENCGLSLPLSELTRHQARCDQRPVKCPGHDCSSRLALSSLVNHVVSCCVERAELREYVLPHKFSYMMNEDLKNLSEESQNFNWKLEGVRFDNNVFFLKVTRKARSGRWFFYVQLVGCEEECLSYTAEITVFRPDKGPGGKPSMKYSGDVCPIDISQVDRAEEAGYCLTLKDGAMSKFFLKNSTTGENEFSVFLNILKV